MTRHSFHRVATSKLHDKVYVDGKPWRAFYGKDYVVAPGEELKFFKVNG